MSNKKDYIITVISHPMEQFHVHDPHFNIDAIVFVEGGATRYTFEEGCQKTHDLNHRLKKPMYGMVKASKL